LQVPGETEHCRARTLPRRFSLKCPSFVPVEMSNTPR
jgi:hypothetical protein